jgi:hypothetical protein
VSARLRPAGMSGACFRALGELGGQATTTEIRLQLKRDGTILGTAQVRGSLYCLAGRKPPMAEVVKHGQAGYRQPNLWQLTEAGRVLLPAGDGGRIPCGTGWP